MLPASPSMQGVAKNKVNRVCCQHILQVSRHNFQTHVICWSVWKRFGFKLGAKTSFETSWAQVWKKYSKLHKMCCPRLILTSLLVSAGLAWLPWVRFGRHFWNWWSFFVWFSSKSVVLRNRRPSRVEVLYLHVPASKLEPLGLKSRTVEPLWRLLGALATVEFEVLCRSYGNCPGIAATQPRLKSSQRSKSI